MTARPSVDSRVVKRRGDYYLWAVITVATFLVWTVTVLVTPGDLPQKVASLGAVTTLLGVPIALAVWAWSIRARAVDQNRLKQWLTTGTPEEAKMEGARYAEAEKGSFALAPYAGDRSAPRGRREGASAATSRAEADHAKSLQEPQASVDQTWRDIDMNVPSAASVTLGSQTLSVIEPKYVPLRVIAALVNYWDQQKLGGRFRLSNLQVAARRAGQGNHPWLLAFDDGTKWLVSYGGQGKPEPTVQKLQ